MLDYFFTDYNWIERQIYSYEKELKSLDVTHIAYISRGGMFPAFVAANILDIYKIHPIYHDRKSRKVSWASDNAIHQDSVVLLCEDVCGRGNTLLDCFSYLKKRTNNVKILTICHFNGSKIKPDFGFYSGDTICVFPWERYTVNLEFRKTLVTGHVPADEHSAYFKYGADLDGIFLPDLPDSDYETDLERTLWKRMELLPYPSGLHPEKNHRGWYIVSNRPIMDQQITEHWLKTHNIPFEKALLRDPAVIDIAVTDDPYDKGKKAAAAKTMHIRAEGITHFYESDPLQAVFIAAMSPMTRICWWNNHRKIRKLIATGDWLNSDAKWNS